MKKIIESQISLFSSTSKVSVPIQICYTDDEVEITINYNGRRILRNRGRLFVGGCLCGSSKKTPK